MRKLILTLVVVLLLGWLGWQMLPGPAFGPVVLDETPRDGTAAEAPGSVDAAPPSTAGDGRPPTRVDGEGGGPAAPSAGPDRGRGDLTRGAPRYDLRADEAKGGHTIARHVGKTEAELRERLARESISAASTYPDLETAERVVALALRRHAGRVAQWRARAGPRPNLVLPFAAPRQPPLGIVLRRDADEPVDAHFAVVVLGWQRDGSYVLTSYPETAPRPQRRRPR